MIKFNNLDDYLVMLVESTYTPLSGRCPRIVLRATPHPSFHFKGVAWRARLGARRDQPIAAEYARA